MQLNQTKLSIIVPFFNEEDNVGSVLNEIKKCQPNAEIIAVDDGSRDSTWKKLCQVPRIVRLRFPNNLGQSAAIYAGLRQASGDVCALMDGDGQNDPADIERLLAEFINSNADIICGYRMTRRDTFSRRLGSRIANAVRRLFLDDGIRDTGCSLKVFSRSAVDLLVPFNGLHRFLPAIFKHGGLTLKEVPVNHRPRMKGQTKYSNWERMWRGLYDLVGVSWLLKRKIVFPSKSLIHETETVPSPDGK